MLPNYQARVSKIQELMSESNVKATILTSNGSLIYYSGALCPWRSAMVIGQTGSPTLITLKYDKERIRSLTWIEDVLGWEFGDPLSLVRNIVMALQDRGISNGFIGAELETGHVPGVLTAREYLDLHEALPKITIHNFTDEAHEVMLIKDNYEIEQLRRASEIADVGMQAGFAALRPGINELFLVGVMEKEMRQAGNVFTWSITGNEVGSGYRQCYSEGFTVMPTTKIIQYGDLVTIDLHPMASGYLSDFAMNAIAGPPSDAVRNLANSWEEIVKAQINALKPGRTVHDVACDIESAVGKSKIEGHCITSYGHGLGTDARIPPVIEKGNDRVIQPRMVIVALLQLVNPSIGGMRLEVPVLITETGNEVLCKTPLKLHICQ